MLVRGIDDMLIHLISNHIAIVLDNDICYHLKFLASKDLAAWVRWITENQSLCAIPECILQQIGIEVKGWWNKRNINRFSTRQDGVSRIVLIEW